MNLVEKTSRARKPDAQGFDEVKIVTVPRYKTSGMSGNEWRISARIEFYRKGNLIHESGYRNVEMACVFAAAEYYRAIDDGKGYFAGEENLCDQEGCSEPASIIYRLKKQYCREGHESEPLYTTIRKFCDKHKRRGDCSFEDADSNYELFVEEVHGNQ